MTEPITTDAGNAASKAPPGSTAVIGWPANRPSIPSKYHHGTPLIAGSTAVRGPISGVSASRAAGQSCAFIVPITRSCGPNARASSLASIRATPPLPSHFWTRNPSRRIAAKASPRAMSLGAKPATASE